MPFPNTKNRLIFKESFKYSFDHNVLFTKKIDVNTTSLTVVYEKN